MFSAAVPDTASGMKMNLTSRREPRRVDGARSDNARSADEGEQQSAAAGVYALVARAGALLSPAQPRARRDRLAPTLLDRDRLGLWHVIPFRDKPALPRIFLPRLADHDRAVYLDLRHDVRNC